jgi:hypothetical protein
MLSISMFGLKRSLAAVIFSSFIAGGVSAMTDFPVIKSDKAASFLVNRIDKGDRLLRASMPQRRGEIPISASPRKVPLGCDAAFSAIAEPARSNIFERCVA